MYINRINKRVCVARTVVKVKWLVDTLLTDMQPSANDQIKHWMNAVDSWVYLLFGIRLSRERERDGERKKQKPLSTQYWIEYSSLTCYVQCVCVCILLFITIVIIIIISNNIQCKCIFFSLVMYSQKLNIAAFCPLKWNKCIVIENSYVKCTVKEIQTKREQKETAPPWTLW